MCSASGNRTLTVSSIQNYQIIWLSVEYYSCCGKLDVFIMVCKLAQVPSSCIAATLVARSVCCVLQGTLQKCEGQRDAAWQRTGGGGAMNRGCVRGMRVSGNEVSCMICYVGRWTDRHVRLVFWDVAGICCETPRRNIPEDCHLRWASFWKFKDFGW
jgi:hypothetical protein